MELIVYMGGGFRRRLDISPTATGKCAAKQAAEVFNFDPEAQCWMLLTEEGEPVDADGVISDWVVQPLELVIDGRPEQATEQL